MSLYFKIEDKLNCSGMCQTGLFYFTKDISIGAPKNTCLLRLKESLGDIAKVFGDISIIAGTLCLVLFLLHFCLYFRPSFP